MLAATGHAVHINPDKSHNGTKMATQLYLLQDYQRVNPIPKKIKKMMHFDD
jgi:hypothetical protein